jgi:hypothetical protein
MRAHVPSGIHSDFLSYGDLQTPLRLCSTFPYRKADDNESDWDGPSIEERFKDVPLPKGIFPAPDALFDFMKPSNELIASGEDVFPIPFSGEEAEYFGIEC